MAKKSYADFESKVDPSTFGEKIIERNIADAAYEWQMIFGTNKNILRYFPSLIDGLKPVERRILYGMYLKKNYKGSMIKVPKIIANTLDFHPHGDVGIGDVSVGMSTDWEHTIPLIYVPGNNGSIKGDKHGATRYLDACMSDFAYDCFFDRFEYSNVDMRMNYLGDKEEPVYLPAKYPLAIINGGFSSIGYGFASNIPQYNFAEVCNVVIDLVKDPNAKVLLYPDIPSEADIIMTKKEAHAIFEKGEGKIKMRARAEIDYINNVITFTSMPSQVTTGQVVDRLVKMKLEGKLEEVKEIMDLTTKVNGVGLQLSLYPDKDPKEVLQKLYDSKAGLKKSNPIGLIMIDESQSIEYSIRSFLLEWIECQKDILRSSFNNRIQKLLEDQHINEVKQLVSQKVKEGKDHPVKIIELSRLSDDKEDLIRRLMKEYSITSIQANTIAGLPPTAYTKMSIAALKEESVKLKQQIEETKKILKDVHGIDNEIIRQMEEGIEKYGAPRKSAIISDENAVNDDPVFIGISEDGYIKKVKADGNIGAISKSNNVLNILIPAKETDTLLLFDARGNMHVLPAVGLPLLKEKMNGLKVVKYLEKLEGTRIVGATIAPIASNMAESVNYVFVTETGFAKRCTVASLMKGKLTKGSCVCAMSLNAGDKLAGMVAAKEENDIILYTDFGDGMRLPMSEIPKQLPASKGAKVVNPRPREKVIGASLMLPSDPYLVFATSAGKVKKTEVKYLPRMQKRDDPLALINLDSGESLVAVKSASEKSSAIFCKKNSAPEVLKVKNIPLKTRAAKADKLLKIARGDVVLSMSVK